MVSFRNVLLLVLVAFFGCNSANDDCTGTCPPSTAVPSVAIRGAYYLVVNASVALTASTTNHSTETYTWASSDALVATVSDQGQVTGHSVGTVTITATGVDSGATGELGLVVSTEIPYLADWSGSGHADTSAEAFIHWDEDGMVPSSCAKCHTTTGFQDFIGDDGSTPDQVDADHPIGQTVECTACHNGTTPTLSHVVFPSGVVVEDLGAEARCMTCHQGRSSGDDVEQMIIDAGLHQAGDQDTVSTDLSFENIHYYPAGATLLAGQVRGGYQYDSHAYQDDTVYPDGPPIESHQQVYDWRFRHVPEADTCLGCHNPHSLEIRIDTCGDCHAGVSTVDDLKDVRMMASFPNDYDGDGDLTEGIYYEIEGLQALLAQAIHAYGAQQSTSICYGASSYPYWFNQTAGSEFACDDADASYNNRFTSWTPRLVRATYNYQMSAKDPGKFAHNAKYTIQLLHDSINDLNAALTTDIDMTNAVRNDMGHFNGAGEAARHWDEDEAVSTSCAQCHGGSEGLHFYLTYGVGVENLEQDNGIDCVTCHTDLSNPTDLVQVNTVTYPSGITVPAHEEDPKYGDSANNLCRSCHMGREAKATIDASIASGSLRFRNVHYLPSAGTHEGADAQVGYEYSERTYASASSGHPGGDGCTDCHSPQGTDHTFLPGDNLSSCTTCHLSINSVGEIYSLARSSIDYNGNGTTTSGEYLSGEHEGLREALLVAIAQDASTRGSPICYDSHSYPYWFNRTTGTDVHCDPADANYGNRYTAWTEGLMKAAHNYQFASKDPGAWAHNFDYSAQLLIDSIEDMGGDVCNFVRPPETAPPAICGEVPL